MSINFFPETKTFRLETKDTSYVMSISEPGHLLHLYYGDKIDGDDIRPLFTRTLKSGFCPYPHDCKATYSLDILSQEFSSDGVGDYRYPSITVVNSDGSYAFEGKYKSHSIYKGKYALEGLPSLFANDKEAADTLEVKLEDSATGVEVTLLYGVFENKNIITRSAIVKNNGNSSVKLRRIMSVNLDFQRDGFDFVHFYGHAYLERMTERQHVTHAACEISSVKGIPGHEHNPSVIICDSDATEDYGECYGAALLYTGNFLCHAKTDQFRHTRFAMGINPEKFEFVLKGGDIFTAPETVLSYSAHGFAKMTHQFHDIFRENACKSKYMKKRRPVLVNNWEATRFDFTGEKIVSIAKEGKKLGADLFVLDDGWFGARNSADAGLGDWTINREKMGGDLSDVIKQVNDMGLMFGLWFEPEMINEDSDLYRAHPDWALKIPGRAPALCRNQLVLDITRKDVRDYLIKAVNDILDNHHIEYVKWDFNRYLTDVYSALADKEHQGEIFHRFVLGFYALLDGIILTHPDILFEGCSGGGARFDGGMLCYQPQIWCSDETDAVWRTKIQYGTSFAYPPSSMGAHVSACPNKKTGRTVSFKTRAAVAMSGTFGYELDTTKMTDEEKAECAEYTALFKKYYDVIAFGDYYRLTDPFKNTSYCAWEHVAKDKSECLITAVTYDAYPRNLNVNIKPRGLDENATYEVEGEGIRMTGKTLMNAGIPFDLFVNQYESKQFYIKRV